MIEMDRPTALVFGASGTIGGAVASRLEASGWWVLRATRDVSPPVGWISLAEGGWVAEIPVGAISGVVWAQGANTADSITDEEDPHVHEIIEANVIFVIETLRTLLQHRALATDAGLVVVSSIWQDLARSGKLSYMVAKAALAGLVRSLVADLGRDGLRVNAVLPGVVDSQMSTKFLSVEQLKQVASETPFGQLVTPGQVASVCAWLAGPESAGVNGQFIAVDGGWSEYRRI